MVVGRRLRRCSVLGPADDRAGGLAVSALETRPDRICIFVEGEFAIPVPVCPLETLGCMLMKIARAEAIELLFRHRFGLAGGLREPLRICLAEFVAGDLPVVIEVVLSQKPLPSPSVSVAGGLILFRRRMLRARLGCSVDA